MGECVDCDSGSIEEYTLPLETRFLYSLESALRENGFVPKFTEEGIDIYKKRNPLTSLLLGDRFVLEIKLDEDKRGAFSHVGALLQPLDDESIGDIIAYGGGSAAGDAAITALSTYINFENDYNGEELPFGIVVKSAPKLMV